MTAAIYQRASTLPRPGHRTTITPMVSHFPQTAAGRSNRKRRLEAELGRVTG